MCCTSQTLTSYLWASSYGKLTILASIGITKLVYAIFMSRPTSSISLVDITTAVVYHVYGRTPEEGTTSKHCPHWFPMLKGSTVVAGVLNCISSHTQGTDPLSCSPAPYTGSVCLQELREWQSCLPDRENTSINSTEVLIPSSTHQELVESQAATLFTNLQEVWPSHDCETEFREFWCLLLFGMCDGQNRLSGPSNNSQYVI